ncbi:MAG TPA: hypothetical protein DE061_04680 [Clostridiales bacterium]|nr:hypothetical protein [Clostridiales bacterium]
MSKFTVAMKRFGGFLKRNAVYFLIILCIASVATVIALAVTRNSALQNPDASISDNRQDEPTIKPDDPNGDPIDKPDDPNDNPNPVEEKQTFYAPVNDGTVSKNYSDTALVWNPTLKQYSTHLALDFTSEDKNVFASCDGTVKETGYNALDGYYVILTHKDGYETRYLSLEAESTLKKGATVKQGQLLGKASTTQGSESLDGDHVHFEVLKNGVNVNPLEVMVSSEK